MINKFIRSVTLPRFTLFLFLYQMVGERLFQGFGFILSAIIFLCLAKLVKNKGNIVATFFIATLCGAIQIYKGASFLYSLNIVLQVINAINLVCYYRNHDFWGDMRMVLYVVVVHAWLSVFVDLFVPRSLLTYYDIYGAEKYHLLHIFYVPEFAPTPIPGLHRVQGIAWESGCLQLLLNIYLFILLQESKLQLKLVLSIIFLIIATYSTAGFFVLGINLLFYLRTRASKHFFTVVTVSCIIAIFLIPFMWDNMIGKMSFEDDKINLSGVVRYRDFVVGILGLIHYPLLGIDMSDPPNNPIYHLLESEAYSLLGYGSNILDSLDIGAGGFTNGIFSLTMMWGVLGLYLLYNFIKCRLWYNLAGKYWFLIPCIFLLSLVSEPISNTALFWFFCIFNVVDRRYFSQRNLIINKYQRI